MTIERPTTEADGFHQAVHADARKTFPFRRQRAAFFIRSNFPEKYALKDQDGILDRAHIAENYWYLHSQPRDAWTFELDLRPWNERW